MAVSILVFLELALRPVGSRRSECLQLVSILVFLELALRLRGMEYPTALIALFQSLFSWNSLFDQIFGPWFPLESLSFNPCFPGTRSSTPLERESRVSPCPVSILVFLELALRHHAYDFLHSCIRSFNPCFPGTRSSTPGTQYHKIPVWGSFNPCFPGTRSSTQSPSTLQFFMKGVSILVFLELALRLTGRCTEHI